MYTMKSLFPFFLTLAVLTLGLCSCNNAGPEASAAKTESSGTNLKTLPAFQISADTAEAWMTRWVGARADMVNVLQNSDQAADTSFLVYGFHLPRLELDSMLSYLGPDPNVWAMLAIKYDATKQAFVPELVFAAEPERGGSWSYYDFTAPCPTACPDSQLDK